jgi:hypothetical protein
LIEQLVTLEVACELIPMPSLNHLYSFLYKHKAEFPGLYKTTSNGQGPGSVWEQRFLSESEILKIRKMLFHGIETTRLANAGRPRTRVAKKNPLDWLVAKALGT